MWDFLCYFMKEKIMLLLDYKDLLNLFTTCNNLLYEDISFWRKYIQTYITEYILYECDIINIREEIELDYLNKKYCIHNEDFISEMIFYDKEIFRYKMYRHLKYNQRIETLRDEFCIYIILGDYINYINNNRVNKADIRDILYNFFNFFSATLKYYNNSIISNIRILTTFIKPHKQYLLENALKDLCRIYLNCRNEEIYNRMLKNSVKYRYIKDVNDFVRKAHIKSFPDAIYFRRISKFSEYYGKYRGISPKFKEDLEELVFRKIGIANIKGVNTHEICRSRGNFSMVFDKGILVEVIISFTDSKSGIDDETITIIFN